MPALFIFLFKVNAALLLFCAGYFLVLRRLTFYTLNRVYLMIAIVFSTAYPLINVNNFASRHERFTGGMTQMIITWKAPANALVKPLIEKPDYWQYAGWIFWTGVVLLVARFVFQLLSLYRMHRKSNLKQVMGYKVRVIDSDAGPFSFWQNIYLNPKNHSEHDLKAILRHEQIHVDDLHMIDILLAEISTIFYWFNPGVWLMKRAVKENIEFITDRKILAGGADTRSYQYSLLSVGVATTSNRIVNNFNLSTIKKRIIMMNAKRSSRRKLARYAFLLPAVVVLLLVFSLSNQAMAKKTFNHLNAILVRTTGVSITSKPAAQKPVATTTVAKPADTTIAPVTHVEQWAQKNTSDTVIYKKGKAKDKSFLITTDSKPDSLQYIINDKQVSKGDIDALSGDQVAGVSYLDAKDVKKYLPTIMSDKPVVMVTTEDSKEGKELANKILSDRRATINQAIKGKGYSSGRTYQHYSYTVSGNSGPGNAVSGNSAVVGVGVSSGSGSSSASTSGYTVSSDNGYNTENDTIKKVVVVGKPVKFAYRPAKVMVATSVSTDSNVKVVLVGKPMKLVTKASPAVAVSNYKLVTVNGRGTLVDSVKVLSKPKVRLNTLNSVYIVGKHDKETVNLEGLSDKLIIIDGKESSLKQMKKISATDISSMSVLSDGAATNAYGDKGKNGVLIITTKKKS